MNDTRIKSKTFQKIRDNTFIVVPAYNESRAITNVIKDLRNYGYFNIVVIDDCSKDNTYDVVSTQNVMLLRHLANRGQGAALRTGIDFALKKNAKLIVTFDSDGQHKAEDIDDLILPIIKGKCDVSLGSRFLKKKSNIALFRRIMLKGAVVLMFFFYGAILTDAHNGLRALSRRSAQTIRIGSDDMAHASEIISEIKKHKIRYLEVPVTILYTDYSLQKGQSMFNAFKILSKMIIKKILEL